MLFFTLFVFYTMELWGHIEDFLYHHFLFYDHKVVAFEFAKPTLM